MTAVAPATSTSESKSTALGRDEPPGRQADAHRAECGQRYEEISSGTGGRHHCRAAGIASCPVGIVWTTRPPHDPSLRERGEQRQRQHADRLALDVRRRIQRHLSALICRGIAEAPRCERVHGFVHGRRKQKRDKPDQTRADIDVTVHCAMNLLGRSVVSARGAAPLGRGDVLSCAPTAACLSTTTASASSR